MSESSEDIKSMASEVWFTSLGDLLTLLLCFFLSAVSFTTFKPHDITQIESSNPNNVSTISSNGTEVGPLSSAGTLIAPLVSRGTGIGFNADDFSSDRTALTSKGLLKMNAIGSSAAGARRVELTTCSPDVAQEMDALMWHRSLERSVVLRRALTNVGVLERVLRVDVRGAYCNGASKDDVAQVKITRIVKSNG